MTTRQRTVRTLLAVVFVAILGGGIAAGIHLSLTSAAASTQRADSHAAHAADLQAQLDQVTAQRDAAAAERDTAAAERDRARSLVSDLKATVAGQHDVNADQAQELEQAQAEGAKARTQADDLRTDINALQDALDAAAGKDAAGEPVAPRFYEDGSWVAGEMSGCAPSALCDDAYQATLED
jgi:uncharacterized protein (DUF3084 family)